MGSARKEISEADKLLVEEYLSNGFDRTAAVLATNKKVTTRGSAREMCYRVFKKAEVKKYIDDRLAETVLSTNQVLAGISELAETAELQRDRLKGYELLGKHLKLFVDRTELTGADGKPLESTSTIIIQGVKSDDRKQRTDNNSNS